MGTNEVIRKTFQVAKEATRGTLIAATHKMYADVNYSYDRPIQDFMDRSGTYFSRRRVAYLRPTIGFSGTDLLTYEDLPRWMELGIKNNVTVTAVGTAAPTIAQSRTYLPSPTTDDIASWSVEFNEIGNKYSASQFMLNSWTIRVDPDNEGAWMLDFEGFARDWNVLGAYASLGERVTEAVRAAGTTVAIDDTTMGLTPVTGKIIDYSITCNLNLHMKAFMEDDQAWAANKIGRGARTFDLTMTMEFDSDVEFAKYRASVAVERKIQIVRSGSVLNGVNNKKAQIDAYGYWRSIGFGDREGNLTATMGLQGFYNVAAATDVQVVSINGIALLSTP
jgi:hypothetical protein